MKQFSFWYGELGWPKDKCIWLCFRYVIEFSMLIWERAFVFHKSKQSFNKDDFIEIVNEDKKVRKLAYVLTSDFVLRQ